MRNVSESEGCGRPRNGWTGLDYGWDQNEGLASAETGLGHQRKPGRGGDYN